MDFAHKCEGMLELGPAHWGTALSAMRFMLLVWNPSFLSMTPTISGIKSIVLVISWAILRLFWAILGLFWAILGLFWGCFRWIGALFWCRHGLQCTQNNKIEPGCHVCFYALLLFKNEALLLENDDFLIKNDDFLLKNDDFLLKNDDLCDRSDWIWRATHQRCDFVTQTHGIYT